jgi:L-arabinokinase
MSAPAVAFYVTGHGLGHATRVIAVMQALQELGPPVRLFARTAAPAAFFAQHLGTAVTVVPGAVDVGMVQHDSLRLDKAASLAAYAAFLAERPDRAASEARWLETVGAVLVVGDIPPVAFEAAAAAGVPGVAITNFSWDWIYARYVAEEPAFAPLLRQIREAYARATVLLRLPLHGDLGAFPVIRDIPLIARRVPRPRAAVRALLGVAEDEPLVVLSFGGFDLYGIDFAHLGHLTGYRFAVSRPVPGAPHNVLGVPPDRVRHDELVAAADAVVTKPGYGIVSECLAHRIPVVYTSRGDFAEYGPLVAGLHRYTAAAFISNEDLLAGRWAPALERVVGAPLPAERLEPTGAAVAARALLEAAGMAAALGPGAAGTARPRGGAGG